MTVAEKADLVLTPTEVQQMQSYWDACNYLAAGMIYPDDKQLLGGIADALKDTVLPELARGSAARKQLQAAIETLRRMAFAAPERDAALAADVADMASVLERIGKIFAEAELSTPPSLHQGGRLGGGEIIETHLRLQQQLANIQASTKPEEMPAVLFGAVW